MYLNTIIQDSLDFVIKQNHSHLCHYFLKIYLINQAILLLLNVLLLHHQCNINLFIIKWVPRFNYYSKGIDNLIIILAPYTPITLPPSSSLFNLLKFMKGILIFYTKHILLLPKLIAFLHMLKASILLVICSELSILIIPLTSI